MKTTLDKSSAKMLIELRVQPKEAWIPVLSNLESTEEALLLHEMLLEFWQNQKADRENQQLVNAEGGSAWKDPVTVTEVISKYDITIGKVGNLDIIYLEDNKWEVYWPHFFIQSGQLYKGGQPVLGYKDGIPYTQD